MKIAVFGAGAMGSLYAARFAMAGHSVVAVDPWEAHVSAINASGLRMRGPDGDHHIKGIQASVSPNLAEAAELVIIATKASAVGMAAKAIAPLIRVNTTVLTIQNGIGAGARIADYLPAESTLLGVADGFGASMVEPGFMHHTAMKLIRLGEVAGGMTPRLNSMEKIWQRAGFNAKAFDDIHQLIWEKLLCNVTLSAPCTVYDCTVGELLSNANHWATALACTKEAYACGLAEKIRFSFDDPIDYVTKFAEVVAKASPSMRLDHMARRASEIEFINGAIPLLGKKHNIQTPMNAKLSAKVRRLEEAFLGDVP
ncbi:2-dehydropantoate 2-reductase [Planktomarina temperata]|nr:2-dehydropantoate 2-reductase [Planktomarina temperata]